MSLFVPIREYEGKIRYINVDNIEYFVSSSIESDTTIYSLRSGKTFSADCDIATFADILNDYITSYPDGGVSDE